MATLGDNIDASFETITSTITQNFTDSNKGIDEVKTMIDEYNSNINDKFEQSFTSVSDGKKLLASTLLTYGIQVKEDAKFQSFSDAIDMLGTQKVAGDTIIENTENDVTANKIIAGTTVRVGGLDVTGIATSDANADASKILRGYTAYVNGRKIEGTDAGFASGYSDGYAAGLAARQAVSVSITYDHHVHSLSTTGQTVRTNSINSTSDGYDDNYLAPSPSGCFQTPEYDIVYETYKDTSRLHWVRDSDDPKGDPKWHYRCNICGEEWDEWGSTGHCHVRVKEKRLKGYSRSCGRVRGQVVGAHMNF